MNKHKQSRVISYAHRNLKNNGVFAIEARSINDHLYGKGTKIGEHEYIAETAHAEAHYRRFIDINEITNELTENGFTILEAQESDEFAPYLQEKPVCIRVIAKNNAAI